jgi:general secretion pathway protein N
MRSTVAIGVMLCGAIVLAAHEATAANPPTMEPAREPPLLGRSDAQPGARPGQPAPPTGNPLWAVPLNSLNAIRERPIFSPSRRPPAVAIPYVAPAQPAPVPTPVVEAERPAVTLVGTVIHDSESIAIFLDANTQAAVRVKLGDQYSGWVLRSVQPRAVVFEKDQRAETFALPAPTEAKKVEY